MRTIGDLVSLETVHKCDVPYIGGTRNYDDVKDIPTGVLQCRVCGAFWRAKLINYRSSVYETEDNPQGNDWALVSTRITYEDAVKVVGPPPWRALEEA